MRILFLALFLIFDLTAPLPAMAATLKSEHGGPDVQDAIDTIACAGLIPSHMMQTIQFCTNRKTR